MPTLRLINPNSPLSTITMPDVIGRMTFTRRALFVPLNLEICAAVVPAGWRVEIVDECVLGRPHQPVADVDLVGIGAMTTQAVRAYKIADEYRALGVTVVMGGLHPSALPHEALQHADAVCVGDAEGTLPHLLNDFQQAGRSGLKKIYDWRDYPSAAIATPRKDLLNPRDYLVFNPIQTTRGCPHNCAFCTTPAIFGRKFRQRDIGDIVEEIRLAKRRFNTRVFIFSDDDFAGNRRWAKQLCRELIGLNVRWASQCDILISEDAELLKLMKRSGCAGLILGLESPRQQSLTEARKSYVTADSYRWRIRKIQSAGISLWGSFIFGFDSDDWRSCMQTVRFAQRMDLVMSCYPILTPYPGTLFFQQYRDEGRLLSTNWDKYNGATVVFRPARMSPAELAHAQMAAFHEFYHPRSALKRLKLLPLKKYSWLANLAIYHGLRYYYRRRNRRLPRFSDFTADGSVAANRGAGMA